MSSKNILVLTVVMMFGINNMIQAGVIPELDLPILNITDMVGKWYLIASTNAEDQDVCTSNIVEQYSEHNFTMYLSRVLNSNTDDNNPTLSEKVHNLTMKFVMLNDAIKLFHIMKDNSYVLDGSDGLPKLLIMTLNDPQENSYVIFCTEKKAAQIINRSDELVFIFSREKTSSDLVSQIIELYNSHNFTETAGTQLFNVNSAVCE